MEKCLILIGTVVAVLLVIPGKTDSNVCWENQWHNNSNPSKNGSEFEYLDATQRAALCPGSKVIAAQCADDKFEGFSDNKMDKVNHYDANCTVEHGLVCHPFENNQGVCPNMAIQYGCECETTTPVGGVIASTATPIGGGTQVPSQTKNVTMRPSQSQVSTNDPTQNGNQNQKGGDHNNGNQGQQSVCITAVLLVFSKFLG